MLDMVLRVYGEQFDVEQFVNQYQDLLILDSFKKGEDDMLGNPSEFSGFDVMIAENETREVVYKKFNSFSMCINWHLAF